MESEGVVLFQGATYELPWHRLLWCSSTENPEETFSPLRLPATPSRLYRSLTALSFRTGAIFLECCCCCFWLFALPDPPDETVDASGICSSWSHVLHPLPVSWGLWSSCLRSLGMPVSGDMHGQVENISASQTLALYDQLVTALGPAQVSPALIMFSDQLWLPLAPFCPSPAAPGLYAAWRCSPACLASISWDLLHYCGAASTVAGGTSGVAVGPLATEGPQPPASPPHPHRCPIEQWPSVSSWLLWTPALDLQWETAAWWGASGRGRLLSWLLLLLCRLFSPAAVALARWHSFEDRESYQNHLLDALDSSSRSPLLSSGLGLFWHDI